MLYNLFSFQRIKTYFSFFFLRALMSYLHCHQNSGQTHWANNLGSSRRKALLGWFRDMSGQDWIRPTNSVHRRLGWFGTVTRLLANLCQKTNWVSALCVSIWCKKLYFVGAYSRTCQRAPNGDGRGAVGYLVTTGLGSTQYRCTKVQHSVSVTCYSFSLTFA